MTGIVAIDECGDLGKNGSRYFVMAAIMSNRSRNLLKTSKLITNTKYEEKYKNTSENKISEILKSVSESNVVISYVVVDKYDFNSSYYGLCGNELYTTVLKDLLKSVSRTSPTYEVNILLDRSSSISEKNMNDMCDSLTEVKVKKCTKYNSSSNKCIQIADYVAGAIWHMYERNERKPFLIIEKNIRRP